MIPNVSQIISKPKIFQNSGKELVCDTFSGKPICHNCTKRFPNESRIFYKLWKESIFSSVSSICFNDWNWNVYRFNSKFYSVVMEYNHSNDLQRADFKWSLLPVSPHKKLAECKLQVKCWIKVDNRLYTILQNKRRTWLPPPPPPPSPTLFER